MGCPKGEARATVEVVAELIERLGGQSPREPRAVFRQLAAACAPFDGLSFDKLGEYGVKLANSEDEIMFKAASAEPGPAISTNEQQSTARRKPIIEPAPAHTRIFMVDPPQYGRHRDPGCMPMSTFPVSKRF